MFFLYHLIRDTLAGMLHPVNTPFMLAFIPVTIACIAAWHWERQGGTAVILTGLLLGLVASLTITIGARMIGADLTLQAIAGLVWALPYVIFGILFRAVAQREAQPAYGSI
jgi:hypothetical protein